MDDILSVQKDKRIFKPPKEFAKKALVPSLTHYEKIYRDSLKNTEAFWAGAARELRWMKPWKKVCEWKPPFVRWFLGGKINVSDNCLDRHLTTWRRNKAAFIWEGESGEERVLTYQDLHREVCKFANVLKSLGLRKGDRVCLYMPLVPELAIAMLACSRIGATHSVVFGGFSSQSIRDRVNDAGCKMVVTADGGYRRGAVIPLKANVDEALKETPTVQKVVVFQRTQQIIHMQSGRDHWWHELMANASADCPPEPLDSEHPLYILYTSGSTGRPKGILHTTGGYLTQVAWTTKHVFDLREEDVFWCTADIGWVTGHTYIAYGPLAVGATEVVFEGVPVYPDAGRFWKMIQDHKVTTFYTAPTAIRSLIKAGGEQPKRYDLSSLRLLGTVGEPINPEAWMWYREHIGGDRIPIVDTWWQTETGMVLITPLPGVTTTKPGSATKPFPGIEAAVVNDRGEEVGPGAGGYLVLKRPWPAMLRGIYGDDARYRATYWERFPGMYFAGDGARIDEDGDFWLLGRVDDVMNVSGHRISTIEVESALVDHPSVAEAAVCGRADALTGQAIVAFVTLKGGQDGTVERLEELRNHVAVKIGPSAKPANIVFTPELPKTRSGKIMRRLLRDVAEARPLGDTTTLADPAVVAEIADRAVAQPADE